MKWFSIKEISKWIKKKWKILLWIIVLSSAATFIFYKILSDKTDIYDFWIYVLSGIFFILYCFFSMRYIEGMSLVIGKRNKDSDKTDNQIDPYEHFFSKETNLKQVKLLLDKNTESHTSLQTMYEKSIASEQFYEGTIWTIGSIFITAAFTIIALALSSDIIKPFIGMWVATAIYFIFLVVFHRFRLSIRLFRNATRILETKMDYFVFRYVYDMEFKKYGSPIRIWTILFSVFLLMVDMSVWFTFMQI